MRNTTTTIAETPTSKKNPRNAAVTQSPPYVVERPHPRTFVNPLTSPRRLDLASPGQESLALSVPIGSRQRRDANHFHVAATRPLVVLVHSGRCTDGHRGDPEEHEQSSSPNAHLPTVGLPSDARHPRYECVGSVSRECADPSYHLMCSIQATYVYRSVVGTVSASQNGNHAFATRYIDERGTPLDRRALHRGGGDDPQLAS